MSNFTFKHEKTSLSFIHQVLISIFCVTISHARDLHAPVLAFHSKVEKGAFTPDLTENRNKVIKTEPAISFESVQLDLLGFCQ